MIGYRVSQHYGLDVVTIYLRIIMNHGFLYLSILQQNVNHISSFKYLEIYKISKMLQNQKNFIALT